jgi:hypothetical protein
MFLARGDRPPSMRAASSAGERAIGRLDRSRWQSFHSNLKRTLLCDRAMSLGWRRGLLDVYAFALMNNALTEARAAHAQDVDTPPVRGRAANLSRTTA